MSDLSQLYQEVILDHCRHPRHFGKPDIYSHHAQGINPICGDEISLYLQIENNILHECQFTGVGCAICISSTSLMCDLLENSTCTNAEKLASDFFSMTQSQETQPFQSLKKCHAFYNIKNYPMRVKCATLAWHTLLAAIHNLQTTVSTE